MFIVFDNVSYMNMPQGVKRDVFATRTITSRFYDT